MHRNIPGICAGIIVCCSIAVFGPVAFAAAEEPIETGPDVGEPIPEFNLRSQNGDLQQFDDLRGRDGLLLLFYRTADW